MADNIVDSLFGPQPWQVQQQQNAGLQQFASQQANRDPLQMAKYGLTMGGGMLAGAGMEAAGYANPATVQAQQRQAVMQTGGDMSTAAGLKAKAAEFAAAGDQQTAMKLVLLAKQQEAKEQQMLMEQKKQALGERKQDFQEQEMFDLKKTESMEKLRLREKEIEKDYEIARQRGEDTKMYRDAMLENRRAMLAISSGRQNQEKPMTEFQRTNFKQKITKSQSELRGVEGAFSDLEAKANELIAHPGLPAATGIMGMAPSIPSGDAAKAEALIQEFKAAIKKQGLEMAREGGSIGQMTEREWPIVESMVANIDPVKLGVEGTKAQIAKAVAYAKNLTKRAQAEHADLVSAMPEELQKTAPKGKINFGDLK